MLIAWLPDCLPAYLVRFIAYFTSLTSQAPQSCSAKLQNNKQPRFLPFPLGPTLDTSASDKPSMASPTLLQTPKGRLIPKLFQRRDFHLPNGNCGQTTCFLREARKCLGNLAAEPTSLPASLAAQSEKTSKRRALVSPEWHYLPRRRRCGAGDTFNQAPGWIQRIHGKRMAVTKWILRDGSNPAPTARALPSGRTGARAPKSGHLVASQRPPVVGRWAMSPTRATRWGLT